MMETPNPRKNRPPMNWLVVPVFTMQVTWIMTPTMMMTAPMNMPARRPQVSMAGPTKGMAATEPIWYIAVTIPGLSDLGKMKGFKTYP